MVQKKESFFWTSYSDLMTSLFFIMLVLFILVVVLLHKRMGGYQDRLKELENAGMIIDSLRGMLAASQQQIDAIMEVEKSTKDLNKSSLFKYRPEYKKYVLNISVAYPTGGSDIKEMNVPNKDECLEQLYQAGAEIKSFLDKHHDNKYILIIEGQASLDTYLYNYELSYKRALGLLQYWIKDRGLNFGDNCEIQISGSGDGKLNTHSMRETEEVLNQRFLIHILPKNIFEDEKSN